MRPAQRGILFSSQLEMMLGPSRSFCFQMGEDYTTWLTGDATMTRVAAANWKDREYVTQSLTAVMGPFNRRVDEQIAIGEIELAAPCLCVAVWACLNDRREILFIGTDDRNVPDWISKGKARSRRARRHLIRLLAWIVAKRLEIYAVYTRSGRNTT